MKLIRNRLKRLKIEKSLSYLSISLKFLHLIETLYSWLDAVGLKEGLPAVQKFQTHLCP